MGDGDIVLVVVWLLVGRVCLCVGGGGEGREMLVWMVRCSDAQWISRCAIHPSIYLSIHSFIHSLSCGQRKRRRMFLHATSRPQKHAIIPRTSHLLRTKKNCAA